MRSFEAEFPFAGADPIRRLLVSGSNRQLLSFHMPLCNILNAVERRGQTVFYACCPEHFESAMAHAREVGVTVQEILGAGETECYELLCGEAFMAWKPRETRRR